MHRCHGNALAAANDLPRPIIKIVLLTIRLSPKHKNDIQYFRITLLLRKYENFLPTDSEPVPIPQGIVHKPITRIQSRTAAFLFNRISNNSGRYGRIVSFDTELL